MILGRRFLRLLAASAAAVATGLVATAAGSGERSASWAWQARVPGEYVGSVLQGAAAADGVNANVRQLVSAEGFSLIAAREGGTLLIGTSSGATTQLEPLAQAVGDQPIVVYTGATANAGQQELVGVTRADIDRVTAVLVDGSEHELPLNKWRGFSYVASSASNAAFGILAYSAGSSVGSVRLPQTVTQSETLSATQPLYGIFRTSLRDQQLTVAAVDPRTLHARPGPALQLPAQWLGFMALSPDGSKLAVEAGFAPIHGGPSQQRMLFVNLSSMRLIRRVTFGSYTAVRALSWPQQNRVIEIEQTMSQPYQRDVRSRSVRIVDPTNGRLIAEHPLTNKLAVRSTASTPLGLLLLLGSSGLHGTTMQLDLVTAAGAVRSLTIPVGTTKNVPSANELAVDGTSGHAYLVVVGGTVFDVDLHSMTMTRHLVSAPVGASLVPPPISRLQAQMFAGKLAVASLFHRPNNNTMPAQGVYLIDPATWTATVLDPTANLFEALGDRLLTYGLMTPAHRTYPAMFEVGHGLSLYDASGTLVSHLYGRRRFQYVALAPGYGHVIYTGSATVALNPHSGRVSFFGPNDELNFNLETGAALGHARVSGSKPPLGPPQLIFRGAASVGESSSG